jgi:hypothetical protein
VLHFREEIVYENEYVIKLGRITFVSYQPVWLKGVLHNSALKLLDNTPVFIISIVILA